MPGYLFFSIIALLVTLFVVYLKISNKRAIKNNYETWSMKACKSPKTKTIVSSLISILCGLLVGCLLLLVLIGSKTTAGKITFSSALDGIQLIFGGIFSKGERDNYNQILFGWNGANIGDMLFRATPLILTGLSVAVAFKTGLFNIGTPGQYLIGTSVTLIIALSIPTTVVPPVFVWLLAFIGGILGGAIWGAIPGFFKAYLNINEVITCIMTNWIAANVATMFFDKNSGPFKNLLDPSPSKNYAYLFKTTHNDVFTSKMGLNYIFKDSQVNGGIIIAILIAIIIYIIMNKTTFGYELKACGSNKNASKYAGINEKRSIIFSMVIAGALSGAAAALYYLSGNTEFRWETYQTLPGVAFNGIPVALLALNNPIGTIFTSIFMAYLDIAGTEIKYMTAYNEFITSIISAIIVYFSAFSLVIKGLLVKKHNKKVAEIEELRRISNEQIPVIDSNSIKEDNK